MKAHPLVAVHIRHWLPRSSILFLIKRSWTTLCLKKLHPFYFCDIFVRFHPILQSFGRNILQEIWNKHKCTGNHVMSYVRTVRCKIQWRFLRDTIGLQRQIQSLHIKVKLSHQLTIK